MPQRLWIIGGFGVLLGGLWLGSMRLTPSRGVLRVTERLFIGLIVCYCLGLSLAPFGVGGRYGPLPAAMAGALGLPGAVLAMLLGR